MRRVILATLGIFSILIWSPPLHADLLEDVLNQRGICRDKTSLFAVWADTGKSVAAYQESLPLVPASSAKLITTYCALKELGPDYQFETKFFTEAPPQNGTIQNLWVRGEGDPSMVSERMEEMIQAFQRLGLKKITGNIYIDDTFFESGDYPGRQEKNSRPYNALTSATPFNFNTVAVQISMEGKKPAVASIPDIPYIQLINKVKRGRRRSRISLKNQLSPDVEKIVVSGSFAGRGPLTLYQTIKQPAKFFGHTLAKGLQDGGVDFKGKVEVMPVKPMYLLTKHMSKPLSDIVQDINKHSNNFMAEQLTKHLGAKKLGVPGSTEKGVEVLKGCLTQMGVKTDQIYLENGSGLSYDDKISAKNLVQVLLAGYHNENLRSHFIASLSVHGVDGTMKGRHFERDLDGVLFAKTGSLNRISALAGFIPSADGKVIAFAIFMNDLKQGLSQSQKLQDALVLEWSLLK